jgi:translation initiation factor IF-2
MPQWEWAAPPRAAGARPSARSPSASARASGASSTPSASTSASRRSASPGSSASAAPAARSRAAPRSSRPRSRPATRPGAPPPRLPQPRGGAPFAPLTRPAAASHPYDRGPSRLPTFGPGGSRHDPSRRRRGPGRARPRPPPAPAGRALGPAHRPLPLAERDALRDLRDAVGADALGRPPQPSGTSSSTEASPGTPIRSGKP